MPEGIEGRAVRFLILNSVDALASREQGAVVHDTFVAGVQLKCTELLHQMYRRPSSLHRVVETKLTRTVLAIGELSCADWTVYATSSADQIVYAMSRGALFLRLFAFLVLLRNRQIRRVVLKDIANVVDRFTTDFASGYDLDIVEPNIRIQPEFLRLLP